MPRDLQILLSQLQHPSDEMSWAAARQLAQLGAREAIEPLLAILDACLTANDQDPSATAQNRRCWGAASALATFREPRAFAGIVRLFRESRGITQRYAARALGSFGDTTAVPILLEVLSTPSAQSTDVSYGGLHHAILQGLADLRAPEAIPLLVAEFPHPDQNNVAPQAARSLASYGDVALTQLVEAQAHADARVRQWAVVAMEGIGGPHVVAPLERALGDASSTVRWQAARIVGELGDAHAIAALEELQDDPDLEVRQVVASSLRKLGARKGPLLPEPGPNRYVLDVYADYNQFYLGDSSFDGDTGSADFWSPDAFARKLAVAPPGLVGVGTARYDFVPIVIEVVTLPPQDELDPWDHVVEASLEVPSGLLSIDGCLSYSPESSPHIELTPGIYRLRVFYAGQNTFDEDWYRVVLWPQSPYEPPRILSAR